MEIKQKWAKADKSISPTLYFQHNKVNYQFLKTFPVVYDKCEKEYFVKLVFI